VQPPEAGAGVHRYEGKFVSLDQVDDDVGLIPFIATGTIGHTLLLLIGLVGIISIRAWRMPSISVLFYGIIFQKYLFIPAKDWIIVRIIKIPNMG
jgi:hypothetical protein